MNRVFWVINFGIVFVVIMIGAGASEKNSADTEKVKDAVKVLRKLQATLSVVSVCRETQEDIMALPVAVTGTDVETLTAITQWLDHLVLDVATEAMGKPKLLAYAGKKKEAIAKLDALAKTFEGCVAAAKPLQEARDEIENDKPGVILGEYWRGAALGSAYYVGSGAMDAKWFESPAQKIGKMLFLPYLKIQATSVIGNADNEKGVLVYPDGTARCRFLLMPGGDPGSVVKEIGKEGCSRVRNAFNTGMNYMGICSGSAIVNEFWFKLWPGRMTRITPDGKGPQHDIVMCPFHPLARMRKAGPVLKEVDFTGGMNETTMNVPNTEYIGFWRNGGYKNMEGKCALLAYSPPSYAGGRLVVCPAHPEVKDALFLSLMCEYSLRHKYALPRNPIQAGTPVKNICGDHQNQYYEIRISEGAKKLDVTLTDLDGECELTVQHGEPPKPKNDPIVPSAPLGKRVKRSDKKTSFSNPKTGVYFIMIHGSHDILNGANYTLTATVETGAK